MKKTRPATVAILLLLCFATSFLSSCKKKDEYEIKSRTVSYLHFDTVSVISSYGNTTDAQLDSYASAADGLLSYYHRLFDIYYEYSGINNLRTINKNAGIAPVEVDGELIEFLEYCKEMFTLTNGKTNVMMGSVLKIWHRHREAGIENPDAATLPQEDALRAAAEHTDINSLVIDREAGTVYITDSEASLDVGAIAKGYATEKLYEKIKAMGADSLALNIGGNIRTIGVMPNGDDWRVGVTNPDRTAVNFAARIAFGESACVTSGNYERYYTVSGINYHHIIDPDTLYPSSYFASVTVVTEDSALADALSTALFCTDYTEGVKILQALDTNVSVLWITNDGSILSEGIKIISD